MELGIPANWRAAVRELYDKVRAKIRTKEAVLNCFSSVIGIKEGCPLSPTLFNLYINQLENESMRKGGRDEHCRS